MKTFFLLIIQLLALFINAQTLDINISLKEVEGEYLLLADNREHCPVSVVISLKMTNMKVMEGNQEVYVLPANSKGTPLIKLAIIDKRKKFGYSLESSANYGDVTLAKYDSTFAYQLPFEKGRTYKVNQGYNGSFSHQNENAIDFSMDEGTPVLAARSGRVVKVVENNKKSCGTAACKAYNNYILVYHEDGTFANYSHLEFKGAAVNVGDDVAIGDRIGYSGNTGWSTGPHLHFEVYLAGMDEKESVTTKFLVDDGKIPVYLIEKNNYTRNY